MQRPMPQLFSACSREKKPARSEMRSCSMLPPPFLSLTAPKHWSKVGTSPPTSSPVELPPKNWRNCEPVRFDVCLSPSRPQSRSAHACAQRNELLLFIEPQQTKVGALTNCQFV